MAKQKIVKVKKEGDKIIILSKIIMDGKEYAQFRQGFQNDHNNRSDNVKNLKEDLVNVSSTIDEAESSLDQDFMGEVKKVVGLLKDSDKQEKLRDAIKAEEETLEISTENLKKLKPMN